MRLHPQLDTFHVAVGLIGGHRKQRIVQIIEDGQAQPARLITQHLCRGSRLQPVLHQMCGMLHDPHRAGDILEMGEFKLHSAGAPESGQLLHPVLATLRQIEVGDHRNLPASSVQARGRLNVEGIRLGQRFPNPVEIAIDRLRASTLHRDGRCPALPGHPTQEKPQRPPDRTAQPLLPDGPNKAAKQTGKRRLRHPTLLLKTV